MGNVGCEGWKVEQVHERVMREESILRLERDRGFLIRSIWQEQVGN